MSNSFSPKKAPNVLNQDTLERLLVALRQPFSIAVLASLVVHGLLWAALPNFLAETEKEPNTKQRIKTIELSPAEQGQLPQLGINPIPQTLLPAKPAKPLQSGTKLPDPKLFNDPSLYNFPTLEPPPPFVLPSLGLPSASDFKPPPAAPKTPSPTPSPTKPTIPSPPPVSPSGTKTPETPQPTTTPTAPARLDKLPPGKLADLGKEGARSRELRSLYQTNGSDDDNKALEAAKTNASVFKEAVSKNAGDNFDSQRYNTPDKVNDLFPQEACPFIQAPRRATVVAIVKLDGQLADPPTLLRPSGVKGLDIIAIDYVKNQKFSPSDRYQIIRVEFTFDPKPVCKTTTSKQS